MTAHYNMIPHGDGRSSRHTRGYLEVSGRCPSCDGSGHNVVTAFGRPGPKWLARVIVALAFMPWRLCWRCHGSGWTSENVTDPKPEFLADLAIEAEVGRAAHDPFYQPHHVCTPADPWTPSVGYAAIHPWARPLADNRLVCPNCHVSFEEDIRG